MSAVNPEPDKVIQLTDSVQPYRANYQAVLDKIIISDPSVRQRSTELNLEQVIRRFSNYALQNGLEINLESEDDSHLETVAALALKVVSDWNNSYSLRSGAALVLDQLCCGYNSQRLEHVIQLTYSSAWLGQAWGLISFLNGASSSIRDHLCDRLCANLPNLVESPQAISFYQFVNYIESPEVVVQLAAEFAKTEAGAQFLITSIQNGSINTRGLEIAASNLICENQPQLVSQVTQWCARECGECSKTASDIWNYYLPASEHRVAAIELISIACESSENEQREGALSLLTYLPEAGGSQDLLLRSLAHAWNRANTEEEVQRVLKLTKELPQLDAAGQTSAEIRSKLANSDLSIELRSQIGVFVSEVALSNDLEPDDRIMATISYQLGDLLNEIVSYPKVSLDVFTDAATIAERIVLHGEEHEPFLTFLLARAANEIRDDSSGKLRFVNSSGRIVADAVACTKSCFRNLCNRGKTSTLSQSLASQWLDIVFSEQDIEGWELVEGVEIYERLALEPDGNLVNRHLSDKFFSGFHIVGFQYLVHLMHERNVLNEDHVHYWFAQAEEVGTEAESQAMQIGPYLCSLRSFLSSSQNSYLSAKAALAPVEVNSMEVMDDEDDWLQDVPAPVDDGMISILPRSWEDALVPVVNGTWKGRPIRPCTVDSN